jgi:hypothetical protein
MYGGRVDGSDVARVSRDSRVITLRHRWPEHVDGRVWDAVSRAFRALAQETADRTGHTVEVYDPRGWMIAQITPEVES